MAVPDQTSGTNAFPVYSSGPCRSATWSACRTSPDVISGAAGAGNPLAERGQRIGVVG
jgi:hypothetical protein